MQLWCTFVKPHLFYTMMLYFTSQFFICFFIGLPRICSSVWLVKLKRKQHFPYWKTHSFQYSKTLEIALYGFEISKFSGGVHLQTPPCSPKRKGTNGLLFIQSVTTLFKPARYFNCFWNPCIVIINLDLFVTSISYNQPKFQEETLLQNWPSFA